jgi:hypothetical protein
VRDRLLRFVFAVLLLVVGFSSAAKATLRSAKTRCVVCSANDRVALTDLETVIGLSPERPSTSTGRRFVLQSLSRTGERMSLSSHQTIVGSRAGDFGYDAQQLLRVSHFGMATNTLKPGTLSSSELAEVQAIADKYGTQIDVVGSRASGAGRNINDPSLPVGKGPGTRSDIDFRYDTGHPQAAQIEAELNQVSGGAGNASTKHSNNPSAGGRASYPPSIQVKPKGK